MRVVCGPDPQHRPRCLANLPRGFWACRRSGRSSYSHQTGCARYATRVQPLCRLRMWHPLISQSGWDEGVSAVRRAKSVDRPSSPLIQLAAQPARKGCHRHDHHPDQHDVEVNSPPSPSGWQSPGVSSKPMPPTGDRPMIARTAVVWDSRKYRIWLSSTGTICAGPQSDSVAAGFAPVEVMPSILFAVDVLSASEKHLAEGPRVRSAGSPVPPSAARPKARQHDGQISPSTPRRKSTCAAPPNLSDRSG